MSRAEGTITMLDMIRDGKAVLSFCAPRPMAVLRLEGAHLPPAPEAPAPAVRLRRVLAEGAGLHHKPVVSGRGDVISDYSQIALLSLKCGDAEQLTGAPNARLPLAVILDCRPQQMPPALSVLTAGVCWWLDPLAARDEFRLELAALLPELEGHGIAIRAHWRALA